MTLPSYLHSCPSAHLPFTNEVGKAVQVSQVGALAAPAMMLLTQLPSAASAPFFVWGPTAVAAGLLMWLLPDTLGASVPEYVQVEH